MKSLIIKSMINNLSKWLVIGTLAFVVTGCKTLNIAPSPRSPETYSDAEWANLLENERDADRLLVIQSQTTQGLCNAHNNNYSGPKTLKDLKEELKNRGVQVCVTAADNGSPGNVPGRTRKVYHDEKQAPPQNASNASKSVWTPVSRATSGDTFYADFNGVRKQDNYIYFWELTDFQKPSKVINAMSAKTYWQIDCKLLGRKPLNIIFHSGSMGNGDMINKITPERVGWDFPPPGSSAQSILKSVCSRQTNQ